MRIRIMVAAAITLGLVATACGDSKDDDSLSGAAVATTTTSGNAVILAGYPGTTTVSATDAFSAHKPFKGYGGLYEFSVSGGTPYTPDSPAADVGGQPYPLVGVPTSFTWSQNFSAPMTIVMRTSKATATKLTALAGTEKVTFTLVFFSPDAASDFFYSFQYRGNGALRGKPTARAVTPVTNFQGVQAGPMEVTMVLNPPSPAGKVVIQHDPFTPISKQWLAK